MKVMVSNMSLSPLLFSPYPPLPPPPSLVLLLHKSLPLSPIETITSPEISKYELNYVSSHKGPSLVATFSSNGNKN